MERDPRALLNDSPMRRAQILAVAITVALNALDGFDVLAISFASPGIAAEWGIDRAALGIVLSMELIGMAVGSVVLGGLADRVGRRPMILFCLCVMALGMFMVPLTSSIFTLMVWRVFTGLGIGGMLAATNAVAAEYSNARSRNLSVSLMAIGYPVGAVLGGAVVAQLLETGDWRSIFWFGGAVTLAFLPIVWFLLPETIPFLCHKRGEGALDKVNASLARMGHAEVAALPPVEAAEGRRSVLDLFRPGHHPDLARRPARHPAREPGPPGQRAHRAQPDRAPPGAERSPRFGPVPDPGRRAPPRRGAKSRSPA